MNDIERREAESHVRALLRLLGHDVSREGLRETPKRYVKFLEDFSNPQKFNFTIFDKEDYNGMIVESNIPVTSICEHHLLPFTGYATVGYIANEKIVGLSKLARAVEFYARRPQTQERITSKVCRFLYDELELDSNAGSGVGVIVSAMHCCMCIRGVRTPSVWTTTTELLGSFKHDPTTRAEFLRHHDMPKSLTR